MIHSRLFVRFAGMVAFAALSSSLFANGVVVQINNPDDAKAVLGDHPMIQNWDRAGSSPFYRFEVEFENEINLSLELAVDSRVSWVDAEDFMYSNIRHNSRGSSLAAIFDRSLPKRDNYDVWRQINFTRPYRRSKAPRIGIVDTGISPMQLGLSSQIVASANFVEGGTESFDLPMNQDTNGNSVPDEAVGHGTMIAGIISQMAPDSELVVARSADSDGVASQWNALKGVVFCVENGAQVVNFSLGSLAQIAGFRGMLEWMDQNHSILVAPIGNGSNAIGMYPALYERVICVTGVDSMNRKAGFSSWSLLARVAAPSIGIESTWWDGSTATMSGTSLAAPFVVGALAALPNGVPSNPARIRRALTLTGKNIDFWNPDYPRQLGKLLDYGNLQKLFRDNH